MDPASAARPTHRAPAMVSGTKPRISCDALSAAEIMPPHANGAALDDPLAPLRRTSAQATPLRERQMLIDDVGMAKENHQQAAHRAAGEAEHGHVPVRQRA